MKLIHTRYLIVGLGVILIMIFLYIKTQAVVLDRHNQLLSHISRFKQVDAVLNLHILEIRQGLLASYDPTVDNIAELENLASEMTGILHQLYPDTSTPINQYMVKLRQTLEQKKVLLEYFKSSNALLHNSLRYLPLATTRLVALLPSDVQDNTLEQALGSLLKNTLIYNHRSETELLQKLDQTTESLNDDFSQRVPELVQNLEILLRHANIVRENKRQSDTLFREILGLPMEQHMSDLLAAYNTRHARQVKSTHTYRNILYGLSVLLLIIISFIMNRLKQTAATLSKTVTDLNYQKFALDQHAIVSITDVGGSITYANERFCETNQFNKQELLGKNHRFLKSGFHSPTFYKDLWETISRGNVWHGQIRNRSRDGHHYWVETTIVPFMDKNNSPYQYVAIRTDITKIKQAEQELHVQAAALDAAANGILITNRDGEILWVNPAFTSMTGYSQKEVNGKTPNLFKSDTQQTSIYNEMWDTILAGRVWHGVLTNRRKDGSLYTEEQTISPVHNDQGEIIRFIAIKQDITERINMEEGLRRSQKMDAIGRLSGGIAHDFNNQLGVIIGYLDFLNSHTTNDDKASQWVDTATRATLRCMDLTRQLLTFSRKQPREKTLVEINVRLRELETVIARSVTPEVEVQYHLSSDLWLTDTDPGEFQDAVLNLVINARDAMPDGGKLLIETCNTTLDTDYAANNPGVKPNDYIKITLSDTGTGMNKETLEHVFEPFFTTKAEGKGTGLGLAMVYGFVKRYGGHVKAYSEYGVGTTLRLYLPRSTALAAAVTIDAPEAELPAGNESILIVDDEADLLQLANHYLTAQGYRTRTARNAALALSILKSGEPIDLLFSDVVMPGGMSGFELAQHATEFNPTLKVLLTSGFTSKVMTHNGLARFSTQLLSKPYRRKDLVQRIRYVLDTDGPTLPPPE